MNRMVVWMVTLLWVGAGRGQDRVAEAGRVLTSRPWMARQVSAGGVRLELRGLYVCGGLLWVCLRGENRSPIDFRSNNMRFAIQYRRSARRAAVQEVLLVPIVGRSVNPLRADSSAVWCYGLMPRVPGSKRELVLEWSERDGDRRMRIRVKAKEILKARRLN